MECPRCGSRAVERLPPSQISPKPGYRCRDCGVKMRSPGMYVPYLIVLLIGVSCLVGSLYGLLELKGAEGPVRMLWLAGVGLVVAGYAAMQLARPAPLDPIAKDHGEPFEDRGTPDE